MKKSGELFPYKTDSLPNKNYMKLIITLFAAVTLLSGCGAAKNKLKHLHSSITGLDRTITLYAADGKVIKSWRTQAQIEDNGGTVAFICDGKAVTIAGTFTVEEK